jgi:hypothetical protein
MRQQYGEDVYMFGLRRVFEHLVFDDSDDSLPIVRVAASSGSSATAPSAVGDVGRVLLGLVPATRIRDALTGLPLMTRLAAVASTGRDLLNDLVSALSLSLAPSLMLAVAFCHWPDHQLQQAGVFWILYF